MCEGEEMSIEFCSLVLLNLEDVIIICTEHCQIFSILPL